MKDTLIKLQIKSLEQQLKVLKAKRVSRKEKGKTLSGLFGFSRARWTCLWEKSDNMNTLLRINRELVDENVIDDGLPAGLSIHNALIVATGLVYKNILRNELTILIEDEEIILSHVIPVV